MRALRSGLTAVVLLTAAALAAACWPASPVPLFTGSDFYAPPDPLPPGEPGDLIWVEPLPASAGVAAWRVLYHSQAVDGRRIAVSGVVATPTSEAPPGGRPQVAVASGTTGLADVCAPSRTADVPASWTSLLDAGYVVSATDYEGLGTPGRHPYLVGDSAGRSVLDAARAARNLPDTGAGDRVALWGHSQGGHAVLFAGELAATWAPELQLVGVAAGAPASQLLQLAEYLPRTPFAGYGVMVVAGFAAAYPQADLEAALTPRGRRVAALADRRCSGEVLSAVAGHPYDEFVTGRLHETDPWQRLLLLNEPGQRTTDAPVLLLHGSDDEQIPAATSEALLARLCAVGVDASRRLYRGEDHASAVGAYAEDLLVWMADRFADRPVPSDCPG